MLFFWVTLRRPHWLSTPAHTSEVTAICPPSPERNRRPTRLTPQTFLSLARRSRKFFPMDFLGWRLRSRNHPASASRSTAVGPVAQRLHIGCRAITKPAVELGGLLELLPALPRHSDKPALQRR